MPLQVFVELQSNLTSQEMRTSLAALKLSHEFRLDYAPALASEVTRWTNLGAKLGDAVITAQLEAAHILILISENRHFLAEIPSLPFDVLSAEEALSTLVLDQDGADVGEASR